VVCSPKTKNKRTLSDSEASASEVETPKKRKKVRHVTYSTSPIAGCSKMESDDDDVLSLHEETCELDDEEDNLCVDSQASVPSKDSSEPDCDFIEMLQKDFDDDDDVGDPIKDSLAKLCNGRFTQKLSDDKLKERLNSNKKPANCSDVRVPSVNKEVWGQIPMFARKNDVKLANTQQIITKAAFAVSRLTNDLLEGKNDIKANVRKGTDALALLGHACSDLSIRRRVMLKPFVNKQYQGICDESCGPKITDKLFGDNLATSIKEAKEMDRLGSNMGTHGQKSGAFLGHKKNQKSYHNNNNNNNGFNRWSYSKDARQPQQNFKKKGKFGGNNKFFRNNNRN
jgi:hypothetical protein